MAVDCEPKPGDWVRCDDRGNWGHVVSRAQGGQLLIRWKSRDGSVATKLKPLSVVTEVHRPQGGNGGPPGGSARPADPGPGRALKALHRFRKRNEAREPPPTEQGGGVEAGAEPFLPESHEPVTRRPLSPEQVERLERIRRRRRPEASALGPCWACGSTRFWRSVTGSLVCGTCHPPACPEYVREWLDVAGSREQPQGQPEREGETPA